MACSRRVEEEVKPFVSRSRTGDGERPRLIFGLIGWAHQNFASRSLFICTSYGRWMQLGVGRWMQLGVASLHLVLCVGPVCGTCFGAPSLSLLRRRSAHVDSSRDAVRTGRGSRCADAVRGSDLRM